MKTPMRGITVYGLRDGRKSVMETLQKLGCVELSVCEKEGLLKANVTDNLQSFERFIAQAKQALALLDEINPEKTGMFSEAEALDCDLYSLSKQEIEKMSKTVSEINLLDKKISEQESEIAKLLATTGSYEAWKDLDVPMNLNSFKNVSISLYTINSFVDEDMISKMLSQISGVHFEIISRKGDLSCIWLMYLNEVSDKVHKTLRENGYVPPACSLSHLEASEKVKRINNKIEDIKKQNEEFKKTLCDLSQKRREIKIFHDYMKVRYEKYKNLEKLSHTGETFILEGYVPENRAEQVAKKLQEKSCYVDIRPLRDDEEAPVLFKNNAFSRPVEGITKTYSMPVRRDIDPNGIMAFFYYLFFGMMFSDAGYGLLVMLATGYMAFIKKFKKDTMMMFFFCGVSTTFWGLMYGSFFGDLIYRFSLTFMGKEFALSPIWIDPVKEPLLLLIFSIVLGLIQIIVGLGINFYEDWRSGEKVSAVCDTGSWIFILTGIAAFAGGFASGIEIIKTVGIVLATLGAATVILMKARDTKNPIVRIFNGILGLYDITSFVSDILSYSRLMALGLATGVIAQVVNIMGTLAGKSVIGVIMFILVFIVGHLLNFAINMLGAYVHTNRLQYVEFYSKFYQGGGREFAPLKMDTEYFKSE